jgi:Right handed beta helix region
MREEAERAAAAAPVARLRSRSRVTHLARAGLIAAAAALACHGAEPSSSPSASHPVAATPRIPDRDLARRFLPASRPPVPRGTGAVWYVDAVTGKDSNGGRSETSAFKTIARAVDGSSAPIGPGDTVLIKPGVYRERVLISRGGTADRPIVVAGAGPGEAVIDASLQLNGWTPYTGSIYRAHSPGPVTAVVLDDEPLVPATSLPGLVEGQWYFDAASGDLYLWCPGGADPTPRTVGVVADDEYADAVRLNDAGHVTLFGLTVRFAGGHGISVLGDGVRIESCRLAFNGKSGVNLFSYGQTQSRGGQVVGNEIDHNVMRNWPRGRYKWGGWAAGVGSNGTGGAQYERNVVYRNNGEGLLAYSGPGGTVIRDNVVFDNWSVNIYVDNQPNARIERNFSFSQLPDPRDLVNNGDPEPGDGRCLRRLRPEGIMTADEKYGIGATLRNVLIANNVVLGCRRGITHYGEEAGSGLKQIQVVHNTVIVPDEVDPREGPVAGISIPYSATNDGSLYRDNAVFATNPDTYLLFGDPPPGAEPFLGLALDHNLWYHVGRTAAFHWGPGSGSSHDYTLEQWQRLAGRPHGAGDVWADPAFVDARSYDPRDKRPKDPGSPLVDRGVDAGVETDYTGAHRPMGAGYDIGALELDATARQGAPPR